MYHFIVNLNSRTGKARKIWDDLREELFNNKLVNYEKYHINAESLPG